MRTGENCCVDIKVPQGSVLGPTFRKFYMSSQMNVSEDVIPICHVKDLVFAVTRKVEQMLRLKANIELSHQHMTANKKSLQKSSLTLKKTKKLTPFKQ